MINVTASFVKGTKGQLFQIKRSPVNTLGYVIYVQPLFETANINRHVYTRSAIEYYHAGYVSIIFDHYGCGDSEGELTEATLAIWQNDLIAQIESIPSSEITLIAFDSATLLLNDEILTKVKQVQLWQPEFLGNKVVKHFQRIALLEKQPLNLSSELLEVSGYQFNSKLLAELGAVTFDAIDNLKEKIICFEWHQAGSPFPKARENSYAKTGLTENMHYLDDVKYWQTTELVVPNKLIAASVSHCSSMQGKIIE